MVGEPPGVWPSHARTRTRVIRRRRSPAHLRRAFAPEPLACPFIGRPRPAAAIPPNHALAPACGYAATTRRAQEIRDRHPARFPPRPGAVFFLQRQGPPRAVSAETTHRRNRPQGFVPDQARYTPQTQADQRRLHLLLPVPRPCCVIAGRCGCCGGCVAEQRRKSPAKSRLLRCCGSAGETPSAKEWPDFRSPAEVTCLPSRPCAARRSPIPMPVSA